MTDNARTRLREANSNQMNRVRKAVDEYRNAPFRSADWLVDELMNICDTSPTNDNIVSLRIVSPLSTHHSGDEA